MIKSLKEQDIKQTHEAVDKKDTDASDRSKNMSRVSPPQKSHKDQSFFSSLNFIRITFFVLYGVLIVIFGVIVWERMQFINYAKKRTNILQHMTGKTNLTQEEVKRFEKGFLKESDIISFITVLETARGYFDTFDIRFLKDTPQGKQPLQYLPIEITLEGSNEAVDAFLSSFFSAPYVLKVSEFNIGFENGSDSLVHMKLTGELYVSEHYNDNEK